MDRSRGEGADRLVNPAGWGGHGRIDRAPASTQLGLAGHGPECEVAAEEYAIRGEVVDELENAFAGGEQVGGNEYVPNLGPVLLPAVLLDGGHEVLGKPPGGSVEKIRGRARDERHPVAVEGDGKDLARGGRERAGAGGETLNAERSVTDNEELGSGGAVDGEVHVKTPYELGRSWG